MDFGRVDENYLVKPGLRRPMLCGTLEMTQGAIQNIPHPNNSEMKPSEKTWFFPLE